MVETSRDLCGIQTRAWLRRETKFDSVIAGSHLHGRDLLVLIGRTRAVTRLAFRERCEELVLLVTGLAQLD
jgi:hypothetical protein